MIQRVGTVSLFVEDQDRAKKFYVDTLGFELRTDTEMYPGAKMRWIAVAPKGAETELILYPIDENWSHYAPVVGKTQAITLQVTDIDKLYEDLKAKGVTFFGEPETQFWGRFVIMQDSEGNGIMLVQLAESE